MNAFINFVKKFLIEKKIRNKIEISEKIKVLLLLFIKFFY